MIGLRAHDFNWRIPAFGAVAAIILSLPKIVFGSDVGTFLATALLAAVIILVMIGVALWKVRRHALAVLAMTFIFLALAWSLFRSSDYLPSTARWLLHAQSYKAQVLTQPQPPDGSLRHIEWDGWGFAGSGDTTVYLVSDPTDGLAAAAKLHSSGKFHGIPCPVASVRRLERSWYTVLFYTDTAWNYCGGSVAERYERLWRD